MAIEEHLDEITGEVLATSANRGEADEQWSRDEELGLAVKVEKV